jgi:hypothetical protein
MITLSPLYSDIRMTRQTIGPHQPIAPVLQMHDNRGIPWLRKNNPDMPLPSDADHRPTADELRAVAHLSIAAGARGLSYYWSPESWYSYETDAPGIWRSLGEVARSLRALEEVVLAAEPEQALDLDFAPQRKVYHWARVVEGELWLGLVNPDVHEPVDVSLPRDQTWQVHEAHADSRLESGFQATLGPAGVLVLRRADPASASARSVSSD